MSELLRCKHTVILLRRQPQNMKIYNSGHKGIKKKKTRKERSSELVLKIYRKVNIRIIRGGILSLL